MQEVLVPLYSLSVLIFMKILVPNPNFPEMIESRFDTELFQQFGRTYHTVAVVPNSTETMVNIFFLIELSTLFSF